MFGGYFGGSIVILPQHEGLEEMAREFHGVVAMVTHGFFTLPFWLVTAGIRPRSTCTSSGRICPACCGRSSAC